MRIEQAAQSPLVVNVGNEKLSIPLFVLDDFCAWMRDIQADAADLATRGLTPGQRVQMLSAYPVLPPTMDDLRRRVYSPEGVRHVCLTCLPRASVVERDRKPLPTPEPVDGKRAADIIGRASAGDAGRQSLLLLALALADLYDPHADAERDAQDEEAGVGGDGEGAGGPDPLTSAASAPSSASAA